MGWRRGLTERDKGRRRECAIDAWFAEKVNRQNVMLLDTELTMAEKMVTK